MARGDGLPGLRALIGQLADDARNLAHAELSLVKSRGIALARRSRAAAIMIVVALLAVHGAVVALAVGLVLQLAALVGGAFAGLIVMLAMLLIAGLLVWLAVRSFSGPAVPGIADKVS